MYKCALCGNVAPPRTPSHRIVVETRPKQYPYRQGAFRAYERSSGRRVKGHQADDRGGSGWEIVREALACPACAEAYAREQGTSAHGRKQTTS